MPAPRRPRPATTSTCRRPQELDRLTRARELAGVVLAAGMRPCAGAIVVLVFALAQGLFAAGIAATFAMALGTALTTGAIATLAVFAKALALRIAGGRGSGETVIAGARARRRRLRAGARRLAADGDVERGREAEAPQRCPRPAVRLRRRLDRSGTPER